MRIVSGFSSALGDYFLPRAAHEPPERLQRQLWPWIEEWEARFETRARSRYGWADGGLDEDDLAADGFLKLLQHLRTVLLQDLAVLQPRYPSLPFYAYPPFQGPEWAAFAATVQASAAEEATEPQSLLLQRALPELAKVIESTRSAILQSSQLHASHVQKELQALQGRIDVLLNGQVPITITGFLGGLAKEATAPVSTAPLVPPPTASASASASASEPGPESTPAGIPIVTALARAITVQDAWREWKEGIGGLPAVRALEEEFGSRWRPGNVIRVQFCRRKVIWDAVLARIAAGATEEAAVAELEHIRNGKSLNRLVDELKARRRRKEAAAAAATRRRRRY